MPRKLFLPGHPGRPHSPNDIPNIKVLAQREGAACIRVLAEIRDNRKAAGAARTRASEILLDRGFGKPIQTLHHRVIKSVADLSDEEIAALLADETPETPLLEGKVDE